MNNTEKLAQIVKDHAVPDPSIVGKLPRGGTQLDYVGHAEVTRILLEIDPLWTIEPVAFDEAGLPARVKIGTMVQAGFWMTVLGHRRYCVGSVEDRKVDIGKELVVLLSAHHFCCFVLHYCGIAHDPKHLVMKIFVCYCLEHKLKMILK